MITNLTRIRSTMVATAMFAAAILSPHVSGLEAVQAPELRASGLVTIYSTPVARRTLDDGRVVELLHDPSGNAQYSIDGGPWQSTGLSDANSPRLHRSGSIYLSNGNQIARFDVDSGPSAAEVVRTFPGSVSIGGGHGDFDATQRYLPIIVGGDVGVYDVQADDFWTRPVGGAAGDAQVGNWDVAATGGALLVYRDGTRFQIASAAGHEDIAINPANGNPALVTVTAGWALSDFQRWGIGESQSVVVIDMITQELIYNHDTGNHGSGWWGLHVAAAGSRIAVSAYAPTSWVEVHDLADGSVTPRFGEGAGASGYWSQRQAAISEDGSTVYYTVGSDTWTEQIGGPVTPPPPPPPPGPGPQDPVVDPTTPLPWRVELDPSDSGLRVIRSADTVSQDTVLDPAVPAGAILRPNGSGGLELVIPGSTQPGAVVGAGMLPANATAIVESVNGGQ